MRYSQHNWRYQQGQLRGMKNEAEAIESKQRGVDETVEIKSKQRGLDAAPRRVTTSRHVQQPQ